MAEMSDSAELAEDTHAEESLEFGATRIFAFGGGKGGIGKSFVTSNVAIGLAQAGKHVVVVDADLGGANLHTCLGIAYPKNTLADFIDNRVSSLDEILLATDVPNLKIISGASDILTLANPQWSQKQKLLRHLGRLKTDYLLLDLGAGTTFNVLDFFNMAQHKFVVVTPEPTSIQNAYGFIKSAMFRRLSRQFSSNQMVADLLTGGRVYGGGAPVETVKQIRELLLLKNPEVGVQFAQAVKAFECRLILNMANPPQDQKVYSVMRSVAKGYLDLDLALVGAVPRDERVPRSVDQMKPLLLSYPECEAAQKVRGIVAKMLAL